MSPNRPEASASPLTPSQPTSRVEWWSRHAPALGRLMREVMTEWLQGAPVGREDPSGAEVLPLRHADAALAYELQTAWLSWRRWLDRMPGFPHLKIESAQELNAAAQSDAIAERVLESLRRSRVLPTHGVAARSEWDLAKEPPHCLDWDEFWSHFRAGDRDLHAAGDPVLVEAVQKLMEEHGVTVRDIE